MWPRLPPTEQVLFHSQPDLTSSWPWLSVQGLWGQHYRQHDLCVGSPWWPEWCVAVWAPAGRRPGCFLSTVSPAAALPWPSQHLAPAPSQPGETAQQVYVAAHTTLQRNSTRAAVSPLTAGEVCLYLHLCPVFPPEGCPALPEWPLTPFWDAPAPLPSVSRWLPDVNVHACAPNNPHQCPGS